MTRLIIALLIALVAIPGYGISESVVAQVQDDPVGGASAQVNCENLLSQADAIAIYEAAASPGDPDPYTLDGNRGIPGVPCETESEFGTESLASCANFKEQAHAQALYEAASGDPYQLDANGDGFACDIEVAEEPPISPAPSAPSTAGCVIVAQVAHASACAGGPARIGLEADQAETVPTATTGTISTGALFAIEAAQPVPASNTTSETTAPRTAEQRGRVVEGEQQIKRKAKKRKARKAKRVKQRQLERQRFRQEP